MLTWQSFSSRVIAMGMYFNNSSPRHMIIRWRYCLTPECSVSLCTGTSSPFSMIGNACSGRGYTSGRGCTWYTHVCKTLQAATLAGSLLIREHFSCTTEWEGRVGKGSHDYQLLTWCMTWGDRETWHIIPALRHCLFHSSNNKQNSTIL